MRFTRWLDGAPVYVNPSQVVSVSLDEEVGGAALTLLSLSNDRILVLDALDEVVRALTDDPKLREGAHS